MSNIFNKENYECAKINGDLERFRGDEISRRIAKEYPLSAQIALLMDKDLKYNEWVEYQAFRQRVKDEVNAEIAQFEYEISHGA
jgi:hypothetical protein